MKSFLKKALAKYFPLLLLHYRSFRYLILNKDSYLYSTGWIKSLMVGKPVDKSGNPIPWMNYPMVKFLEGRLKDHLHLFEYGSGYSTFFFSRQVKDIISVEYDEVWYQEVKKNLPKNTQLIFKKPDEDAEYCRAVLDTGRLFDVIVVDGRDRVNCIKQGISALTAGGILILDDSERECYREGIDHAKKSGFRALDFEGLKATGFGLHRSTIFYRDGNCLEI